VPGASDADVVVIGAGPAGCTAARELARLGHRVVLLEARRFPRWKPCAGGISVRGLEALPPELRELVTCEVRRAEIRHAGGTTTVESRRPVGGLVRREMFDAEHAALAVAAGAGLREGCPAQGVEFHEGSVRVETPRGWIVAAAAVGADGAAGFCGRALRGRRAARAAAYEAETAPVGPVGTVVFDFTAVPRGYAWSFPRPDGASVGGFAWPGARGLRGAVERYVADRGAAPRRWRGHPVPVDGLRGPVAAGRLVLAGDAAGAVDPLTGEGIAHALESGRLAATAVHRLLAGGVPLAASLAPLRRLGRELRLAGLLARWLYAAPARRARLLFGNAALVRWMTRVVRGERGYLWLLGRALAGWPALVRGAGRPAARVAESGEARTRGGER